MKNGHSKNSTKEYLLFMIKSKRSLFKIFKLLRKIVNCKCKLRRLIKLYKLRLCLLLLLKGLRFSRIELHRLFRVSTKIYFKIIINWHRGCVKFNNFFNKTIETKDMEQGH